MKISNREQSKRIKRGFNLGVVILLLPALFFVWKEMDLAAIINAGVLVLYIVGFHFVGLNYIEYDSDGDLLRVRYYPIISFFNREYSSIEFRKELLYQAEVKKTFLFFDLYLAVKTRKGIAEYPELSLAALNKNSIRAMQNDLVELSPKK
ncbi:MAG TPA: hypothetical protein VKA27_02415 [Sunxiuqinia sp.]|nr:hypothetical protein [Sunxiuqinia sp.]